jgi:hypothetical protein
MDELIEDLSHEGSGSNELSPTHYAHKSTLPRHLLSGEGAATKAQIAAFFQVSTRTIDSWMALGLIPYWKVGSRCVRFDLEAVKRRLDNPRFSKVT